MSEERRFILYKKDFDLIGLMVAYFENHFSCFESIESDEAIEFIIDVDQTNRAEQFALHHTTTFFNTNKKNIRAIKELELLKDFKEMMK